jgi:Xaa-Pro aminopeptidase
MSPVPRDRGVLIGMMGLEDGARVDFTGLRAQRRAKVLSGMENHDLDALMLGGVGDVRYVSGARQLGRAGVLPFAPVAVVVRETARVHLLSTWDEGVPPEIGHDELYGLSWSPANLAAALATIPGLRDARRVGTDGLTPMFAGLLSQRVTAAELVDAAPVMAAARRTKTPDEITCLDVASAIAEAALSSLEDALAPGITERELLAVYYERVASLGAPVPPTESVCFATPTQGPVRFRYLASDRPVGDGELVVLAPGALYAGYEAGLARTRVAGRSSPPGTADLATRCAEGIDVLISACRPGNTGADLFRAWESVGNEESPVPLAHGLGLGAEPPVIGLGRGSDATLEEGMVLSVQSWVAEEGIGGCLERATVRIDSGGPTTMTRYGRL